MSFFNNSEFLKFSNNQNYKLLNDTRNQSQDPKLCVKIISFCMNDNNFSFTNGKLMCNVCDYYFESIDSQHFTFTTKRHIECPKHTNNLLKNANKRKSNENLNKIDKSKRELVDEFLMDITRAFLSADIAFEKLANEKLKSFLFKYTHFNIPTPVHLRENIVPKVYKESLEKVRQAIGLNKVYVMYDETTDTKQRSVMNVLVGVLDGKPNKPYLISTQFLESTDGKTLLKHMKQGLDILWPNGIRYDDVLLIVTDQAPACITAGELAKLEFKNAKHVTCLAHAIHRVTECVRNNNDLSDSFISIMKKILTNSPKRRRSFKEITGLCVPKQPIITRWGTWLETSFFYAKNFDKMCLFIEQLRETKNKSIIKLKKLIENQKQEIRDEIKGLTAFEILTDSIIQIQKDDLSVDKQIKIIKSIHSHLKDTPYALNKLKSSLTKNPDINYFNSNNVSNVYKYAQLTTAPVERSFSRLNNMITDQRLGLTKANIEKYLFVNYNQFL